MGLIKSKSNYILKSKHQLTNDGTIYERDATTIGGLDKFVPNQVPVYKSSNFLITINNGDNISRDVSSEKWEENENGEIWTLSDVSGVTNSNNSVQDDIVIKQDYYSLRDFAYYGSCAELVRSSITDILSRFPGELYGTTIDGSGVNVYYTDTTNGVSELSSSIKPLGGDNYFLLDNPFNINMHLDYMSPKDIADELKYFCNDGFKNYEIINGNGVKTEITTWKFTKKEDCKNRKVGEITLNSYTIYVYKGDDGIVYLYKDKSLEGFHIRPKESFYKAFFKSLDNFQKILMNPNTEPKYKATFEVVSENDFGYKTNIQSFVMPLNSGGYNIGGSSIPFKMYVKELSDISIFYDDRFCDNLYRSMTHESIKNFDWTYTKEFSDGEEEEYVVGGEKIAKVLRLYGRQLDDIKVYIDNITNLNTLTYNDVNNLPDYFLTDTLENDGWDLKNIFPLKLSEYIIDEKLKKFFRVETEDGLNFTNVFKNGNDTKHHSVDEKKNKADTEKLYRIFNSDLDMVIDPYNKTKVTTNICGDFKGYSSEKKYTMNDVNNHFMRVLRLNSKQLLRHKGTVVGIEMLLSIFGLKSDKWFNLLPNKKTYEDEYEITSDYTIREFTSFTKKLDDVFDDEKKMFKYDWYNSTKMIAYPTNEFINGRYTPYQGLPVIYKEGETKEGVRFRNLYPYFGKNSIYDGDFYYQMKGGWLRKGTLQFDKENNVIIPSKTTINDANVSSDLFTETLKTTKRVSSLKELTSIPMQSLFNNEIYYVSNLNKRLAIVDGQLYEIRTEETKGQIHEYFSVYVNNGAIRVGDVYFYGSVTVSTPYNANEEINILLSDKGDSSEIKVYIINNTIKAYSNDITINNFGIFENRDGFSNYFRINNVEYKSEISMYGWEQLRETDSDYYRLNAIVDNFKGNNPHNGNLNYDNGYEYFTYFRHLFKYAHDNELFDKRCYRNEKNENIFEDIYNIGFKGLIDDNDECNTNYDGLIKEDSKIHYFGDFYSYNDNASTNIFTYPNKTDDNIHKIINYVYGKTEKYTIKYDLKNITRIHNTSTNIADFYSDEDDPITHQIMNNKLLEIEFNIGTNGLTKDNLEKIKYIDSVIIPYMEQFIPSTSICTIKYNYE